MKELRAFFEMTGLTLLPLVVLFLAVFGPLRTVRGTSSAGAAAAAATPAPESAAPPREDAAAHAPAALREELVPPPEEDGEGERQAASAEPEAEEPAVAEPEAEEGGKTPETGEKGEEEPAPPVIAALTGDEEVRVDILFGSRVENMSLRDYLLGVVAAEMPASFAPAALEAQAVAARTDTFYRLLTAHPHKDAACCTDPGCCKAYLSPEELRRRWGEDYERWMEKIAAAVDATAGEILTWEGAPIFAAFHAASAGRTEASEDVWVTALPYLRSVSTGETEADVPSFRQTVRFSAEELAGLVGERVPGAVLPEEPERWLTGERRSASGRLLSLEVGGVTLSGNALRSLLGLRSTAVRWAVSEGVFTFETEGYGHGVGLSQYGAEVMARAGSGREEILLHYYTGAELSDAGEIFPG